MEWDEELEYVLYLSLNIYTEIIPYVLDDIQMIRAMAAEGNKGREAPPLTPAENEAFLRMLRDAGQRYAL